MKARDIDEIMIMEIKNRIDYCSDSGVARWKVDVGNVKAGSIAGNKNVHGYIDIGFNGSLWRLHRIIYAMHHGPLSGLYLIDHINGNRADNRFCNLRMADYSQNIMNTCVRSGTSSGVKGVHWCSQTGKWRAEICAYGKRIRIGRFSSIDDAQRAVSSCRERIHAEYANYGEFKNAD